MDPIFDALNNSAFIQRQRFGLPQEMNLEDYIKAARPHVMGIMSRGGSLITPPAKTPQKQIEERFPDRSEFMPADSFSLRDFLSHFLPQSSPPPPVQYASGGIRG